MTSVRATSSIAGVRWPLAEWALLSCLLGCGRASLVVGSRTGTGGGNGGMAAPGDGGGGLGGSMGGGAGGAQSLAGSGGAPASGGAPGTVPFVPVDPQVSRQWRWQPCGSIPPIAGDAAQVIFPPAGNALAVLYSDGIVMQYPRDDGVAPKLLRSGGGTPPASIAFSLDGAWLAEVAAGAVRMRDVATGTMVRDMQLNSACTGTTVRFSAEGDHVLAWDQTSLCVWQTADGAFVTRLTGTFSSAGMREGRILTVEPGAPGSVKSWSLSGGDHSEIALETTSGMQPAGFDTILVSPRADTLAGLTFDANQDCSLWSAGGTLVTSFSLTGNVGAVSTYVGAPVYAESGAVVLFGTEVVDVTSLARWTNTAVDNDYPSTIDETGMLIAGINAQFAGRAQSGSPDARRLFGFPYPSPPSSDIPTVLSVSPDGSRLAAATAGLPVLWRLAPDFAASVPMRRMWQGIPLEASFSASRGELVFSGDGWALFSAGEGALLIAPPPPANVPPGGCFFNLARFSSDGQWLALGGFGAAVNVLARDGLKPVASLPTASCEERGTFNGDGSLLALSGPELYRTSDWSLVWPAQIAPQPPPPGAFQADVFRDVQFAPGEKTLLVSGCAGPNVGTNCAHAIYSVSDGTLVQRLPQLNGTRARFSGEGNWIVSGNTALHVPTSESVVFDPSATLSTFAPNGDIIAFLGDSSLARYCRTP